MKGSNLNNIKVSIGYKLPNGEWKHVWNEGDPDRPSLSGFGPTPYTWRYIDGDRVISPFSEEGMKISSAMYEKEFHSPIDPRD